VPYSYPNPEIKLCHSDILATCILSWTMWQLLLDHFTNACLKQTDGNLPFPSIPIRRQPKASAYLAFCARARSSHTHTHTHRKDQHPLNNQRNLLVIKVAYRTHHGTHHGSLISINTVLFPLSMNQTSIGRVCTQSRTPNLSFFFCLWFFFLMES